MNKVDEYNEHKVDVYNEQNGAMLSIVCWCAGRGGGRGYQDAGPPDYVLEAGTFAHACEGEAVVRFTIADKVGCRCIQHTLRARAFESVS